MDAMPAGSYLVLSHGASDIEPAAVAEMMRRYNGLSSATLALRSREQGAPFFRDLDLTGPGMVPINRWVRADVAQDEAADGMAGYCGIARKP